MTNEHPKLARIRALLAKAEASTFEGEAESFREKAYELLARYGIDEALATAAGATREEIGEITIVIEGSYQDDKRSFLHRIAVALGCQTFAMCYRTRQDVKIWGYSSDLERVELLFTSLLLQGLKGMQGAPKGHTARNTTANRRAWFVGFDHAVYDRLVAAEKRAQSEATEEHGTSTAVVLRDRKAAVKTYYEEYLVAYRADGGRVTTHRTTYSGRGYREGRAAGERADIGQTRVGGQRQALR